MNVENSQPLAPPVGKHGLALPMYKRPGEPEHYRVTATRLGGIKRQSPKTPVVSGVFQPAISFVAFY